MRLRDLGQETLREPSPRLDPTHPILNFATLFSGQMQRESPAAG